MLKTWNFITGLFLSGAIWAQSTPKHSNEFLSIGVGARGMAMGGTQVAVVEDATAGYWNPAGLSGIKSRYAAGLMHAEYFAGIAKYDFAAFATKIDSSSVLGASVIRFAVDDIPDTRFLYDANGAINYDNIRFFTAADYAFLLSYARKTNVLGGLRLGGNFKVIHRLAGNFATAWGFGADFGAQLNYKQWSFGVMGRDITTTFNAWNHNTSLVREVYAQTDNEIPENSIEVTLPKLLLGVAHYTTILKKFGLLASLDLHTTFDGQRNVIVKAGAVSMDPSLGLEFDYRKLVFLRGGVSNLQEVKNFDGSTSRTVQINFGIGVTIASVTIDYALTDIGDQSASLYSHVFSLKAAFGTP